MAGLELWAVRLDLRQQEEEHQLTKRCMTVREYQRSRDKKAWQHIEVVIMSRLDEMKGAEGKKKAIPVYRQSGSPLFTNDRFYKRIWRSQKRKIGLYKRKWRVAEIVRYPFQPVPTVIKIQP